MWNFVLCVDVQPLREENYLFSAHEYEVISTVDVVFLFVWFLKGGAHINWLNRSGVILTDLCLKTIIKNHSIELAQNVHYIIMYMPYF